MSTSITCREREQEQMLLLLRSLLGYILRRETKGPTSSVMKKSIDRQSHHNIKGLIPAILTQVTVHRGQSGWHWPQKQVLTIQHTESCWAITPLDWNKLTNQFHQGDDFGGAGRGRPANQQISAFLTQVVGQKPSAPSKTFYIYQMPLYKTNSHNFLRDSSKCFKQIFLTYSN